MMEITVNTEKVIRALEKVEKAVTELRGVLAPGVFKKEAQRPQTPRSATDIMILNLNVNQIPFKLKGGAEAMASSGFAFTFLRKARDGPIWEHNVELHNAIEQYGKVKIGQFVYQLDKNGVFIQRIISKE